MKYVTLGKTDLVCSCIGIGGAHYEGKSALEFERNVSLLLAAFEHGINVFDSCEAYSGGYSEAFIGAFLEKIGIHRRSEIVILTKLNSKDMEGRERKNAGELIDACDHCLLRLKTGYIDVLQTHDFDVKYIEMYLEAFERLQAAGKIRHYGVSHDRIGYVREFDRYGRMGTVQLGYSIFGRELAMDLIPHCVERNYGTVVRTPLYCGLLTGAYLSLDDFAEGDSRKKKILSSESNIRIFHEMTGRIRELIKLVPPGTTLAQVALAYVVAQPGLHVVIPGAFTPEQVGQNAKAGDLELGEALLRAIEEQVPATHPGLYIA